MRSVPVIIAFLILFAGCAAQDSKDPDKVARNGSSKVPATVDLPPISELVPVAPQVLVSPEGHRLAEFMVARNPLDANHLIIAAHDYDNLGTGTMSCVLYVSRDGGATWTQNKPIPGLDQPHLQFDGWVSFDMQGVAHYVCLDYYDGASTIPFYTYSEDGGITWAPATLVTPMADGCDKTSLHAAKDGRVYIACGGDIARTDDRGKTWLPLTQGNGSNPNGFAEDSDGTIYIWLRGQGGGGVARTTDRGDNWNRSVVGPFNVAPGYNDQNRWVDQRPWTTLPSIFLSPVTEHLFVAQQSWNTDTSLFETHVYVSVDRGATFQEVESPGFSSPTCSPCHVAKPSIAVDDAGRVGLLVQLVNDGGHIKEVMFSASSDEGQTWATPIALSKTAPPNEWQGNEAFTPETDGTQTLAGYLTQHPDDAGQIAIGVALTSAVQELQMRWNGEYWGIHSSPLGFVTPWIDHSNSGTPQVFARIVAAK